MRKGKFKTHEGKTAIVAQVRPVEGNNWVFFGAIEHEGVLYLASWNIHGHSLNIGPHANLLEHT